MNILHQKSREMGRRAVTENQRVACGVPSQDPQHAPWLWHPCPGAPPEANLACVCLTLCSSPLLNPGSPNLPRGALGPRASRAVFVRRPGASDECSFCWPPARWKSLLGKPSAVKRRKRCRGCGRVDSDFDPLSQDFRLVFASFDRPRAAVTSNLRFYLD